jgi:hypothetical protein
MQRFQHVVHSTVNGNTTKRGQEDNKATKNTGVDHSSSIDKFDQMRHKTAAVSDRLTLQTRTV